MIEVAIDIRMIEFHARQYDMLGTVVKELRPLVKKGTVIFVPLYHHVISFSRVPYAAKMDVLSHHKQEDETKCAWKKPGRSDTGRIWRERYTPIRDYRGCSVWEVTGGARSV